MRSWWKKKRPLVARAPEVRSASSRPEATAADTVRREVISLAWPIATAMLGDTAMGLVDTRLVSGLGPSVLGGVGMATVLMFLSYSVVFGVMRGVKVRAANAVGEGVPARATRYAQVGVAMGLLAGVAVWALGRDITWALRALSVDPAIIPPARSFLAARTSLAPAACALSALVQWRQGVGDSRTPMRVTLFGNALNAALAYSLIGGHFGLPRLGPAGAGYATALVELVSATLLGRMLWRASRDEPAPDVSWPDAARAVIGVGGPTGLQFGAEMLAFTAFTAILGSLGAAEIAAHQVSLATIRVSFLPGIAVAEAASVLVGRALGRRDLAAADAVTRAAVGVGATFMAACGAVFAVGGEAIARGFTDDPMVVARVVALLRVAAVFQVLDAVNIVLRGALRGARDVRAPALIGIAVVWVCVPGFAWALGLRHGMGALGGWIGFVAETTVGASLFAWRWRYGAWRRAYDEPAPSPSPVFTTQPAAG